MKTHEIHQFIDRGSEFFKILKQIPAIGEDGPWVAGGSVWKAIEQIPLECDIDVFFKSAEQCERWYRKLLSLPYVHRIVSDAKSNRYNTTLKYHVYDGGYNKTITLQLISFKFFSSMQELLDGFDFTVCQFGFDGNKLYFGDTSYNDLRNREIIFHSVVNESATAIHLEKYTKIGFKIPESQKQRYDEIMKKTSSPGCTTSEPGTIRASILSDMSSEEDGYPEPENPSGLNLSQIGQVTTQNLIQSANDSWTEPGLVYAPYIPSTFMPVNLTISNA